MTIRALTIGSLLAIAIAALTHYNDQVIRQTMFIGNHLPLSVFGLVVMVLLLVNPLLGWASARLPLRAGELALIAALGTAGCAWPASNLMRVFAGVTAWPAQHLPTRQAWTAANAMSYVPGGSFRLAEGYVADWSALLDPLTDAAVNARADAADADAISPLQPAQAYLRSVLPADVLPLIEEHHRQGRLTPLQRQRIVRGFNEVIAQRSLFEARAFADVEPVRDSSAWRAAMQAGELTQRQREQFNRALIEAALPGAIRPPPRGQGIFVHGGDAIDAVTARLAEGADPDRPLNPSNVPWSIWWPTIRLWIGLALLAGLASLCLALIVHPQWAHRELLPYPTVQFLRDVATRDDGRLLPNITRERLFWYGFAAVVLFHFSNGLNVWLENWITIDRSFDFNPLRELFPNARRVTHANYLFYPTLYPAVIGFGFFIHTRVSLSLGLSLLLWVMLGAWLLASGLPLNNDRFSIEANGTALRFGAYVAAALMILYFGRRHYFQVAMATIGISRHAETPGYCVWAGRGLVLCSLLAVGLLHQATGLSPLLGGTFVLLCLIIFLVLSRINAETGLFYAQPDWLPVFMIGAFFGVQGLGPEAYITLLIAGLILVADPREALMPYLVNGLRMSEQVGRAAPTRTVWPLGLVVVATLAVAVVVTLTLQHNLGVTRADGWTHHTLATGPLNQLSRAVTELSSHNELQQSTGLRGLSHLSHARPDGAVIGWMLVGAVLLLGCSVLRLRVGWWPLHPVLFLVWGTYPAVNFAASFLMAAIIKGATVKFAGERGYHHLKPLMIGLIAADLFAALGWNIVGWIYYHQVGVSPEIYRLFPT